MSATSGTPPTHHPYRVDAVREHEDLAAGGQFVRMLEVTFTGPSGSSGTVNLPIEQASPAQVDAAIQARLDLHEGIANLGPEPHPDNLAG